MSKKNGNSTSDKNNRLTAGEAAGHVGRPRTRFLLAAALAFSGMIAGSGVSAQAQKAGAEGKAAASSAGKATESAVTYPASLFDNGKARFYSYKTEDGITIKYFILKSSDGVIRAAFDACDVCWRAGKGYAQEGDTMVCRNCGRKFASVKINEVKGGCNPAPLKRTVEAGKVVIQIADLLEGRQYFNFSARGGGK